MASEAELTKDSEIEASPQNLTPHANKLGEAMRAKLAGRVVRKALKEKEEKELGKSKERKEKKEKK